MAPPPQWPYGCFWLKWKFPSQLVQKPIPFLQVVSLTSGNDIRPIMESPAAPWNDMIDRVGMTLAVGAAVVVS